LTETKITAQPTSELAIRIIMALVPLIFMGIGIAISFKYKIDDQKQKEIADAIRNQAENQDDLIAGL
jgi:Na+/melibiose symporter-like transporter